MPLSKQKPDQRSWIKRMIGGQSRYTSVFAFFVYIGLDYQYRPASVVLFDHAISSPIHHPCMAFVHSLNTSMMHDHQQVNGVLFGVMHQQFELDCFYSFCSVVHNICS